jgi:hypothetical protein
MVSTRLVFTALLGIALAPPGAFAAGLLFQAGAGAQYHDYDEKGVSGSTVVKSGGDGTELAYQVLLGISGDMASVYGIYSGTGFIYDEPPGRDERVRRMFSLAGGGVHLYMLDSRNPLVPYVLGGGGLLFYDEKPSYHAQGYGYFGGLGLRFTSPFSIEARYLGGQVEGGTRSLTLNAFQVVFSLMAR